MHLPNDITYPVLFLAIIASGSNWTGTNPVYTAEELARHLELSQTTHIVTKLDQLEIAKEAVAASTLDITIIRFSDCLQDSPSPEDGDFPSVPSIDWLLRHPRSTVERPQPVPVVLMGTSGTSGLPKIAIRSLQALIIENQAIMSGDDRFSKPYLVRRLFCVPIFHAFAMPLMMIMALRQGHVSYFMPRFGAEFYNNVQKYRITEVAVATRILTEFVHAPPDALHSLRLIWYGGSPSLDACRQKLTQMYPKLHLVPAWGMTEGGWFSTLPFPETDQTGSVGYMLPRLEVTVAYHMNIGVRDDGLNVGELMVRGPQLMTGYLKDSKPGQDVFEDGWFGTGDAGYIQNGKVYIVNRLKDLIKVNGFQVAPLELEHALASCPSIHDCCVVRGNGAVTEFPLIYVVRDKTLTEGMIKRHMSQRLASYKVRHCQIRFVSLIPRGHTGKVLKACLEDSRPDGSD